MGSSFFDLVAQFATSDADESENVAETVAKLLDKEGQERYHQELRIVSLLDRKD